MSKKMETLRMYCESKMTNNQAGDSKGARQSHLLRSVCAPLESAIYAAVTPTCLCTEDCYTGISGLNFTKVFLNNFASCGQSPHIFSAVWK